MTGEKQTLSDVFDRLREISGQLASEEVFDVAQLYEDGSGTHRTVVYVRLPWPHITEADPEINERLMRLLTSINRPDTIKADIFTVVGEEVIKGYQPNTNMDAKGVFDPDEVQKYLQDGHQPYVLQVTIDIVKPAAIEMTLDELG